MAEGNAAIPGEDIILGYQNKLARANHENIVLDIYNQNLQRDLKEALEDNDRLRKQIQEQGAERIEGASAPEQEASE